LASQRIANTVLALWLATARSPVSIRGDRYLDAAIEKFILARVPDAVWRACLPTSTA
jgi:hypothetical protein